MSHPEESAPCFNSAHTHASSSSPMSHFLCTVLLGFSCAHSPTHRKLLYHSKLCGFIASLEVKVSIKPLQVLDLQYLIVYVPHPLVFSRLLFYFLIFCTQRERRERESLCSLDLIVFSLLLPRLSTSFRPPCQKTQLSGMRFGPIHRKRGTATEAKTDGIHKKNCLFF